MKINFPYSQASTAVFALLCFLMYIAYRCDVSEMMGSFYFGLLIIYRVVHGMVIKRHYWQIADEKVSFFSLLTALILSTGFLALLLFSGNHLPE